MTAKRRQDEGLLPSVLPVNHKPYGLFVIMFERPS